MAYVTGTASTFADLLSAIQTACTSNGWTLSGNVLHKGTCYAEITNQTTYLQIRGGTGIDGSNALTGVADSKAARLGVGGYLYPAANTPFVFPTTYEVFINTDPDEVYVIVNYSTSFYEFLGWGQTTMPGLSGTGNWYCGCYGGRFGMPKKDGGATYNFSGSHGPFHFNGTRNLANFYGVDHRLDSDTWQCEGAWRDWASIAFRQPNQWNTEAILQPIRVYATRPSGFVSPVLECAHARYLDISAVNVGQVLTLGTDKWKVYPWWARGTRPNVEGDGGTFTGTYGWALRYDGP